MFDLDAQDAQYWLVCPHRVIVVLYQYECGCVDLLAQLLELGLSLHYDGLLHRNDVNVDNDVLGFGLGRQLILKEIETIGYRCLWLHRHVRVCEMSTAPQLNWQCLQQLGLDLGLRLVKVFLGALLAADEFTRREQ